MRVPEQLSIVSFDIPAPVRWLGDRNPTHIELPLTAMGRRLAELAREIIENQQNIMPPIPEAADVNDIVRQAVEAALFGGVPAQEALSDAVEQANALLP